MKEIQERGLCGAVGGAGPCGQWDCGVVERFQGGTNIQESVRSGTPLLPKGPGSHTYIHGGLALERMGSESFIWSEGKGFGKA